MERRGQLQETGRGCVGHEPGEMGQYMKQAERERDRERGEERPWGGGFHSESGSSSQGPPKAQGRYRRVSGQGAGLGQQLARVRTPAVGAFTLVGVLLSL